jgi:hypothetical protein
MIWLCDCPSDDLQELMQMASAMTGLSVDDIEKLLDSGLETPHLVEYLSAVMTKRMN